MRFVRQFSVILLLLTPLVLVGTVVLFYAINIPYWDDYKVQDQLQMLVNQPSAGQKIQHLFDQHWEHRIVWTRLIFLAFYTFSGQLNYYGLTLIGVSGLLVLVGILFAAFRRLNLPLAYFIPVPFWLCTLQSHENLIWAMASIQNFYVLVFAVGTFYALAQNTPAGRWLAAGLGVMATFTSGNGPIVLIAGGCVLGLQRNGRWLGGWVVLTAGCLLGYFHNYQRVSFFPSPFKYGYGDWVKAFFVFLGGFLDPYPYSGLMAVGYQNPLTLIMVLGLALALAMAYFGVTSQVRRRLAVGFWDDFFAGISLFLLATAVITVFSRVGFAGPGYLLQGRYKVYPALALSSVYLYSLYRWSKMPFFRPYATGVAVTTVAFSLFTSYLCLEGIINQQRRTVSAYVTWLSETPRPTQAVTARMYTPPPLSAAADTTFLHNTDLLTAPSTAQLGPIDDQPFLYNIAKLNALNPTPDQPLAGSYIVLKSPAHSYVFAARPRRPGPLALSGLTRYFTADTFYAQVLKENLEPGRYRLGILSRRADRSTVQMTDQYVTFRGL
ncbi:MAG: hypothetical protein H7Z72_00745 [Bacteroidetes bacterium]|nr:hypothetical protein [Fibrella sp.]